MKKVLCILMILGLSLTAKARTDSTAVVDGIAVSDFRMEHDGSFMTVDMLLDLKDLKVESNRAVLLTPRMANGADSINLPAVGIYGRRRYYYYVRNGHSMLSGSDETSFRASQKPDKYVYHTIVPYAEWMNGADLTLHRDDYGCCNTLLAQQQGPLGHHAEAPEAFFPELVYVRPQAELVKSRALEGSAFIDFRVDKTDIDPEYRRNTVELAKIQVTIDSVRNDRDVTITQVWLKGFASPESPYAHNKDLAIGRTAALKNYIQQLYSFGDGIIVTDYEPEDWAGLRRYVEQGNLDHKTEILAIIDSDLAPDAKELKIKRTYPQEYKFLLQNCYPALRHTDYRIAYNVRSYSNADEIKRIMAEAPQKLSLNEFYIVAQQYEPGTDEFTDVFETAVRMYPGDEIANLNAANAAMRLDNLAAAERYLDKAGHSAEAVYARGALAIRRHDFDTARRYLSQAAAMGLKQAALTLSELDKKDKNQH